MHPTLAAARNVVPRLVKGTATHPLPRAGPTGVAFSLVRQLLQERPKHFHELIQDGIRAVPSENAKEPEVEAAGPSSTRKPRSTPKSRALAAREAAKLPTKRKDGLEVPEGHPFISGTFLKKRIMPVLESQHLVRKEWREAPAGSLLFKAGKEDKKHSMFALCDGEKAAARWEQIINPEIDGKGLRKLGREAKEETREKAAAAKERRHAAGEPRTEREIWAWQDRPKGRTTNLERVHLNSRRRKARDGKEELEATVMAERLAARDAARAAFEQEGSA